MSDVSLKEYVDRQIAALEKSLEAKIASVDRAVATAHRTSENAVSQAASVVDRRLESMNEFRAALSDQTKEFVTKALFEVALRDIRDLAIRLDRAEGHRGGMKDFLGWIVAGVALTGMLLALADRWGG